MKIQNRSMFCPNCGNSDQSPESYCRRCGNFLPDFDKLKPRETAPETHLNANAALSVMTAAASLTLTILLYVNFLGRENTPVIIYITAGFLTAMFAWQAQVFWRNLMLKKHFKKHVRNRENVDQPAADRLNSKPTVELLQEADFENIAPASVVEKTTRKLKVDR